MKRKVKFENYKNCLVATQPGNKINYLGKYNIGEDSIKENHKDFIKSNKSISKIQQRSNSEEKNVFTEELNKIALISNDNKRRQSIDSLEIYAYGASKDIVSE